ncbi:aspartyl-phosphate phosphatase Spo0E family protein [Halalkalibacter urbisdiaboli]|uniref:aspartyl-phosphate phosphatase Spo0E family protein n=1 Tax=Halalkalibacter urbisdiaboli TaxID=1960589 RepID=UPI0013FD5EC4|nr:aspartyl-phosphate phosphatase Spo0E family protein [Halalkalibacter urbisdiaboli]
MEKTKSVTKLLHDIETNRQTLNELAMTEKLQSQTLLIQSQKLDELINEYQYITKKL